eukprot:TRINITY_DN10680_c0_g3_i1.p1 TRINITY_DN10680_c0_g3~~TRINITY_DN10680_c0_g3_i1.p1  ORF type:complete len:142 (-),score=23.82 TRINITY_DN10680_c0_g3_i1:24-449(-)
MGKLLQKLGLREAGQAPRWVEFGLLLPLLAMCSDLFETSGFYWQTVAHPELVSGIVRPFLQYFNYAKWFGVAGSLVLIMLLGVCVAGGVQLSYKPKQTGHSHGGVACGGHGAPPAPAPARTGGHSHGDKPCGGHSHAAKRD